MAAKKEEAKAAEKSGEKTEGKKSNKGLIIGIVGALVVGGGGFAATKVLGASEGGDEAAPAQSEDGEIIPLESFVVNLADKDTVRFARVGLAAVYADGADTDASKARMPLVRNALLRVFVPKTSRDLTELEKLDQLHEELTEAARAVYTDGSLLRIVVTDVVVQ